MSSIRCEKATKEEILADHVAHCVEHAITSGNKTEQRRKVGELRLQETVAQRPTMIR